MDNRKKIRLISCIIVFFGVIFLGFLRFSTQILEGDQSIIAIWILVPVAIAIVFYYADIFKEKDLKKASEMSAEEYFEMQKRRMKLFLLFFLIILFATTAILNDFIGSSDSSFTLILVFTFCFLILLTMLAWYYGVKKDYQLRQLEESGFNKY